MRYKLRVQQRGLATGQIDPKGQFLMTDSVSGGSPKLRPAYEDVQAHYDISNDFFGLFQDPSRTYSSAFYERDDMTLEEAQIAKIDLALGKLDLEPGMTLLDVGCGWASVMKRAVEKYDVNVVGLTLSKNQRALGQQILDQVDTGRSRQVRLLGWEEFDEPVDRIVSIEAFEAFPKSRYKAFFDLCYRIMPGDGRMVLQTIMGHPLKRWPEMGIPITMTDLRFMRFIAAEIFPGGSVPCDEDVVEYATGAGFSVERLQKMTAHYVRTLDSWAKKLEAARDEAIAVTSTEVYDRYMRYLIGCSDFFQRNVSEVGQFTLVKG
jgi:cyclopropane-fatty-acyl-phospholipid synthase